MNRFFAAVIIGRWPTWVDASPLVILT